MSAMAKPKDSAASSRAAFDWLVEGPESWQKRPGGWVETRYEAKARRLGHEVWYFRFRRRG